MALVGGGIKGAVAAAKYAADHDLVLLHVGYGQASCAQERAALEKLRGHVERARLLTCDVVGPHEISGGRGGSGRSARPVSHSSVAVSSGGDSSQMSDPTAPGEAADPAGDPRGLLPVMIALGVRCAVRCGAHHLVTGVSQAIDEAQRSAASGEGRPDHRRAFIHAADIMSEASLTPRMRVAVEAPLIQMSYPDVLRLAVRFQVPLDKTWTCVTGGPAPCRKCTACVTRRAAFRAASMTDPLDLRHVTEG
ncbi:MAG: hypothetical protein C4547_09085 [Phycisphaerales bacterium]|nr:MAG: hypothetical protein C4547_09085 [Phycisphaerales bacterium]